MQWQCQLHTLYTCHMTSAPVYMLVGNYTCSTDSPRTLEGVDELREVGEERDNLLQETVGV